MSTVTKFADRNRRHVLQITNHGVHEWQVVPGLPDTGGQNVYVNQFTEALVKLGYRVTILNRGGYPHPVTGKMQRGEHFHESGHARILYLEDGDANFVRKEDMDSQLPRLADDLKQRLDSEDDTFDLIISHYWDGCKLGVLVNRDGEGDGKIAPHVWVPHSLGAIKKRNMDPSTWANLRIDERIENEQELVKHLNGCVATSSTIRESFEDDYNTKAKYFLPPCVDTDRIRPMEPAEFDSIWSFLADLSPLPAEEIKQRTIITEISRTDKTKRKDVLIKAFAQAHKDYPDTLLAVSIDQKAPALYEELQNLIDELDVRNNVLVLGSIWEQLPMLYNATDIYCTPSVMEGFGMSAQEAASTRKPVISSNLVPYVCEYLLGPPHDDVEEGLKGASEGYLHGAGAMVVMSDYIEGFAAAMKRLLGDDQLRHEMGNKAYDITIPYFTWENRTKDLLDDLGVTPDAKDGEVKVA